jgi:hypothetical protein
MLKRKLAVLAGTALTLTASAAFAGGDYYYRDGYRHYHRDRVVVRTYVAPRPVYYAAAPVYYAPAPAYYAPAPAYYGYGPGPATVGGAVLGAVIGNQVASHHNRALGTVAGAVIGGAIGRSIDYGY